MLLKALDLENATSRVTPGSKDTTSKEEQEDDHSDLNSDNTNAIASLIDPYVRKQNKKQTAVHFNDCPSIHHITPLKTCTTTTTTLSYLLE